MTTEQKQRLTQAVLAYSGLVLPGRESERLERAFVRLVRHLDCPAEELLQKLLRGDAAALQALTESLTVHESYFFRGVEHYRFLLDRYLPPLLPSLAARQAPVRVWAAATGRGEELYSFVLLLQAQGLLQRHRWELLGTDISHHALAEAVLGTYSQRSVYRGEPPPGLNLESFFTVHGHEYRLHPRFREAVRFSYCNLNAPTAYPAGPWHVVFLRNVLIYLHPSAKRVVLERISAEMAAQGVLLVSSSEARLVREAGWEEVEPGLGVFGRPDRQLGATLAAGPDSRPVVAPAAARAPKAGPGSGQARPEVAAEADRPAAAGTAVATELERLRLSGAFDEVLHLARRHQEANPFDAGACFLLGRALFEQNRIDEATVYLKRARYLDNTLVAVHIYLAHLNTRRGAKEAADASKRMAEGLLRLMPPEAEIPFLSGETRDSLLMFCHLT